MGEEDGWVEVRSQFLCEVPSRVVTTIDLSVVQGVVPNCPPESALSICMC